MYRNFNLGTKTLLVKPYNTELELKILETLKFNEFEENEFEPMVDELLEKCVKKLPNLSKIEKILTVWYIRSITLGDEISILFKCPKCGKTQNIILNLENILSLQKNKSDFIEPKIYSDEEFNKIKKEDLLSEDLDIESFEEINIFDYFSIYNEKTLINCLNCDYSFYTELFTFKQCLSFLSEDSLESLTSWLHILVYSDNLTRSDVLNMTPLERMIEINYFNEQCKKENEDVE